MSFGGGNIINVVNKMWGYILTILFLLVIGIIISGVIIYRWITNESFDWINIVLSGIVGLLIIFIFVILILAIISGSKRRKPKVTKYGGGGGGWIFGAKQEETRLCVSDMKTQLSFLVIPESPDRVDNRFDKVDIGESYYKFSKIGRPPIYVYSPNIEYYKDPEFIKNMINGISPDATRDYDILFPITKPSIREGISRAVLGSQGHYVLGIINFSCTPDGTCTPSFLLLDPKRTDANPEFSVSIARNVELYYSDYDIFIPDIRGCALQTSTDSVNCGYYVFDMIKKYLVEASRDEPKGYLEIIDSICPGDKVPRRGILSTGLGMAFAAAGYTEPGRYLDPKDRDRRAFLIRIIKVSNDCESKNDAIRFIEESSLDPEDLYGKSLEDLRREHLECQSQLEQLRKEYRKKFIES